MMYLGRYARVLAIAIVAVAASRADARPTQDDKTREARRLYEQGIRHYNVTEYDSAIAAFKEAYLLSAAPELLFNIAQAYRRMGPESCRSAVEFYRNYLNAEPNVSKHAAVQEILTELGPCSASALEPAAQPSAPPSPDTPSPPMTVEQSAGLPWDLVLMSGGAVVAAAGGVLLWSVSRDDGCRPACSPAQVEGFRTRIHAGYGLLGGASVAAAAGLALLLYGSERAAPQAYVVPSADGVTIGGRF
jgi:hypothetical protein